MSITSHIEDFVTKEDYYENSRKGRVNENEITNAMIYWELETCLGVSKSNSYVLKDGPIMHQGLVWKDSQTCFSLLEKVVAAKNKAVAAKNKAVAAKNKAVAAKNIVGIVKDFRAETSVALWRWGRCLKPKQYLIAYRGVNNWFATSKTCPKEGPLTEQFK